MPQQVPMSFQVFSGQIKVDHLVAMLRKPSNVVWHLFLARWMPHSAGNYEFAKLRMFSDEDLVRREDHVVEVFHGIDQNNLKPALLEAATQVLPLVTRLDRIDRQGTCLIFCSLHLD